jgi:hypothetical protein
VLLSSLSPAQLQGLMQQLQSCEGPAGSQGKRSAHNKQQQEQYDFLRQGTQAVGTSTTGTGAAMQKHARDADPPGLENVSHLPRVATGQCTPQSETALMPTSVPAAEQRLGRDRGSNGPRLVSEIPPFEPPAAEPKRSDPLKDWQTGGPHINLPGGNWMQSQEYTTTAASIAKASQASGRVQLSLNIGDVAAVNSRGEDEEICKSPRLPAVAQTGNSKISALAKTRSRRDSPSRSPLGSPREVGTSTSAGPTSTGFAGADILAAGCAPAGSPRVLQPPPAARGFDGSPRLSGTFPGTNPQDVAGPAAAAMPSGTSLRSPAGSPRVIWGGVAATAVAAAGAAGPSTTRRVSNEILEEGGVPYPAAPHSGIGGALSRRRSLPSAGLLEGHKSLDKIPEVPGNEERSTSTDG